MSDDEVYQAQMRELRERHPSLEDYLEEAGRKYRAKKNIPHHTAKELADAVNQLVDGLAGVPKEKRREVLMKMIPDEPRK